MSRPASGRTCATPPATISSAGRSTATHEAIAGCGARRPKLAAVAAKAEGWRLVVYDCYRPTRAVADFVAWSKDASDQKMKAEYYPGIDKSQLFKAGFIATRSEHSRGTTVDIGAETMVGEALDFGTPFDSFFPESATASTEVSAAARANRQRLVALMAAAGFENYRKEWWHFTFQMERPKPQDVPIE